MSHLRTSVNQASLPNTPRMGSETLRLGPKLDQESFWLEESRFLIHHVVGCVRVHRLSQSNSIFLHVRILAMVVSRFGESSFRDLWGL
ncbi:hypothetical protein TNCV_334431 [Trichonephila clavipes]|nr:hypothetical protein TNCV_334431 [Trichonephila clavipes]